MSSFSQCHIGFSSQHLSLDVLTALGKQRDRTHTDVLNLFLFTLNKYDFLIHLDGRNS